MPPQPWQQLWPLTSDICLPLSSPGVPNDDRNLLYLPGFSITEVQKKQAMLNASKQHHAGKPKGESHLNTGTV